MNDTETVTLATIENMRKYDRPGVFAFSPITLEEYSADPADYWNAPDGWIVKDMNGEPMILAYRHSMVLDIASNQSVFDFSS